MNKNESLEIKYQQDFKSTKELGIIIGFQGAFQYTLTFHNRIKLRWPTLSSVTLCFTKKSVCLTAGIL